MEEAHNGIGFHNQAYADLLDGTEAGLRDFVRTPASARYSLGHVY